MNWFFYIVVSLVASSCATILQRYLLKGKTVNPAVLSFWFQTLPLPPIFVLGFFMGGFHFPAGLPILAWFQIGAIGVIYTSATILMFKALEKTQAPEFIVLFSFRTIVAIAVLSLLIKKFLNIWQLAGIVLIIASILIVAGKHFITKIQAGEKLTLLSAFLFGLGFANDRTLSAYFDNQTYLLLAFLLPSIGIALYNIPNAQKIVSVARTRTMVGVVSMAMVSTLSTIMFYLAIFAAPTLAQVAAVNQTQIILTILLSSLILREKSHLWLKLFAGVLSLVGGALLA